MNYKGPRDCPSTARFPQGSGTAGTSVDNTPHKCSLQGWGCGAWRQFLNQKHFPGNIPHPPVHTVLVQRHKMVKFVIRKTENKPKIYSSEFKVKKTFPDEDMEVKALADSPARAGGPTWTSNILISLISDFHTLKRPKKPLKFEYWFILLCLQQGHSNVEVQLYSPQTLFQTHICCFFNGKIIPTNPQGLLLPCADKNEQNESKLVKPGLCICWNSTQPMTEFQLENVQHWQQELLTSSVFQIQHCCAGLGFPGVWVFFSS